jgi:hypothetical protein
VEIDINTPFPQQIISSNFFCIFFHSWWQMLIVLTQIALLHTDSIVTQDSSKGLSAQTLPWSWRDRRHHCCRLLTTRVPEDAMMWYPNFSLPDRRMLSCRWNSQWSSVGGGGTVN